MYLEEPTIVVQVDRTRPTKLIDTAGLDKRGRDDLLAAIARMAGLGGAGQVTVIEVPEQHIGLGTKTALILAALHGLRLVNGLDMDRSALQRVSGRGGASGIGIHLFFGGGFVTDAGHPRAPDQPFTPSSAASLPDPPPLAVHLPFPSAWAISLIRPSGVGGTSGSDEVSFFRSNTPLSRDAVLDTFASLYHGLVPAVATADLELFAVATRRIQHTGFKRLEVGRYGPVVAGLLAEISTVPRVATGMSSMGPLLYAVSEFNDHDAHNELRSIATRVGASFLHTAASNSGAKVETWR